MSRNRLVWSVLPVVLVVLAVLGWLLLSPRPQMVIFSGKPTLNNPESTTYMAADVYFTFITGAAGLIWGLASSAIARATPRPVHVAILGVGGLAGSCVVWLLGHFIQYQTTTVPGKEGALYNGAIDLQSKVALLVWPLLAVLLYGVLVALARPEPAAPPPQPAGEPSVTSG